MGLGDDHDGIIELPADAPVGAPFAAVLGLDDPVIDVAVTPDRADCLGVARHRPRSRRRRPRHAEAARPVAGRPARFDSPIRWQRDLPADQQNACPYVAGRYFRGVKNGPSPRWLQDRLTAIGLRPISALVDITNYVTFDLGRPLHVFDADEARGRPHHAAGAATARGSSPSTARPTRSTPSMTVIADAAGLHGIGGIMGGEHPAARQTTTEVFLEVALFDPIRTAADRPQARHRVRRALPLRARRSIRMSARLGRRGRRTR